MIRNKKSLMLPIATFALALLGGGAAVAETVYKPEATQFITPQDNREISPGTGLYLEMHSGNGLAISSLRAAEGKGRSIPLTIAQHEGFISQVIKGSLYFKAGYNGEYSKVLRQGDIFIMPDCAPHAVIFGWDANEETITRGVKLASNEMEDRAVREAEGPPKDAPENYVDISEPCKQMKNQPPITWTVADVPTPPSLKRK